MKDPLAPEPNISLLKGFAKSAAFTVWRPTSNEAISAMMKGNVTGKGLDVKGKSAKCGKLSGLIPFLQIHDNNDKKEVQWPPRDGRMHIYFKNANSRNLAEKELTAVAEEMEVESTKARNSKVLRDGPSWEVEDSTIYHLNNSGFGIDVAERIFFETYINRQDISREGTGYENGRPSEPAFQNMNCACTRTSKYSGTGPRAVVYQLFDASEELSPLSLVIAYEEDDTVTPVASDFDCFTVGTRGVVYDSPIPDDQIMLAKWLVKNVETVLENPEPGKCWTTRWLEILKNNAEKGFKPPHMPEYGYGDPKSYAMMAGAARRFRQNRNGAVRHGAECFNYYFPQDLDDHFLFISETLPGNKAWKYVNADELKEILSEKIDEGYTFPLNPKWILADVGWKHLYDKMLASDCMQTQKSLDSWYPPDSGIRELIESIHQRYPDTFLVKKEQNSEGTEAMDLAQETLRRHLVLRRAIFKVRVGLKIKNSRGGH